MCDPSMFIPFILISLLGLTAGYREGFRIGIILREGDEIAEKIVDNVLWRFLSNGMEAVDYMSIKEKILVEDPYHYHQTVCKLLSKGVGVLLTSTSSSNFQILTSYSNEYNLSLISPALLETPQDPNAEDLMPRHAIGIQPSTTRAMLDLIRDLRWQEIVYIYDDDYGPEKLQKMFQVGYNALHLKLIGFARVNSAEEANRFLRSLDNPRRHGFLNVILDTDIELAHDILQLHLHHTGVRKKNYHFVLSQPTLESFWLPHAFGPLRITGFLALPLDSSRIYNEKREWMKLLGHQSSPGDKPIRISDYYYHDAAHFLSQSIWGLWHKGYHSRFSDSSYEASKRKYSFMPNCLQGPADDRVSQILKRITVEDGLTGRIEYSSLKESRININLTIVQSTPAGYRELGSWSDMGKTGGIRKSSNPAVHKPGALPQTANEKTLRITTIISPPYMMLKKDANGTELIGNDRFEGYCKDMIDMICESLQVKYELYLVKDGIYGKFDPLRGRWSGMMGDVLDGKKPAHLAVADLTVTAVRQKVVEFTDPFDMISFSLLMKNPESVLRGSSSMFFIFAAFTSDVWICILVAAVLFCILFHVITKFTGAPDSIESVSGIWGRKNAITLNIWFAIGSSMMQGTGVYPRSISSRILTGAWWFSTSIFTCLFIASLTAQLRTNATSGERSPQFMQLKSLSIESILLESLTNGWPKVGLSYPSHTSKFVEESNLPLYKKFKEYYEANPDVRVANTAEGAQRVRESEGNYILMTASAGNDYAIRQAPCDLFAVHDSYGIAGFGIAISPFIDSVHLSASNISEALSKLQNDGVLGHLHRKWWIESSQCKQGFIQKTSQGTLHSISGILCIFLAVVIVLLIVFGLQFSRRIHDKESRRQQLTFDDMNLDNRLPTPPPELLAQPTPVLNVPEIENRTLSATSGSESFKDFFDRMRGGP